jgi:hypothetical protein
MELVLFVVMFREAMRLRRNEKIRREERAKDMQAIYQIIGRRN